MNIINGMDVLMGSLTNNDVCVIRTLPDKSNFIKGGDVMVATYQIGHFSDDAEPKHYYLTLGCSDASRYAPCEIFHEEEVELLYVI